MITALTIAAAVGAGVVGGLLFVFSNVVMPSLDRQSPAVAARTMNDINVVIVNPLFLLFFGGTAVVSVVLAADVVLGSSADGGALRLAGACLYVIGVAVLTAVVHIPRNNQLADARDDEASLAAAWTAYVRPWMLGNHVRAAAAIAACALFAGSLA